jgi:hypothetical protein
MKKLKKILIAGIVIIKLVTVPAFSFDLDVIQDTVGSFSENMAASLPFFSTMGLNWSDAYIGKLLAIPPNFGVGLTLGFTSIGIEPVNKLLDSFNTSLPVKFGLGLPLPFYTVDARLGGFIPKIPFDIGLKIGFLPEELPLSNVSIQEAITGIKLRYLLIGGDIRVSLLPARLPFFKFSFGLGYNHLNGGISVPVGASFGPLTISSGYSLSMTTPEFGLLWSTNCIELKAQASISTSIISPYAGIGLNYSWSKAGYRITSKYELRDDNNAIVNTSQFIQELNRLGIENLVITDDGVESIISNKALNARIYGGFSLNMSVIRLDLTGMYDLFNKNWGGSLGIRFQAKSLIN